MSVVDVGQKDKWNTVPWSLKWDYWNMSVVDVGQKDKWNTVPWSLKWD